MENLTFHWEVLGNGIVMFLKCLIFGFTVMTTFLATVGWFIDKGTKPSDNLKFMNNTTMAILWVIITYIIWGK